METLLAIMVSLAVGALAGAAAVCHRGRDTARESPTPDPSATPLTPEEWTPEECAAFDIAERFSQQAAMCIMHGYPALASQMWLLAASETVTPTGHNECLRNALEIYCQATPRQMH